MIEMASYGDLVTPDGYEHAEDPGQVIDETDTFDPRPGLDNS